MTPDKASQLCREVKQELAKAIIGQDKAVEELLVSLFAKGHCLLIGVPGLAKTLLVKSLSEVIGVDFKRVQFTPDLMPSDILGAEIINEQDGKISFDFQEGPIFTNLLLADEINRTPPKTQAALLEAMQEKCVTIAGQTRPLPEPFLVVATQNPIEQEGTYPLPEAQLDRFMFSLNIKYPTMARENGIEGMSVVSFTVMEDGTIQDAKILRDPGGGCGKEALRIVKMMNSMPKKWTPGKQRGKSVRVKYNLPVRFKLN